MNLSALASCAQAGSNKMIFHLFCCIHWSMLVEVICLDREVKISC